MKRGTVLIGVAAALAVYMFVIEPLDGVRAGLEEEYGAKLRTLMKQEAFVEMSGNAAAELEAARLDLEEKERFIVRAEDRSLAFAKLQAKVQDLASVAQLRVSTIKLLPAVEHKGYTGLPMYIECTGDIVNLSDFLNFLDSSREFIGIEGLDVAVTPQGKLRVKMQLTGLMKA